MNVSKRRMMERRAAVAQEDLGGGSFDESKAANYSIPRCELARYVQVPAPTLYGSGRGAAVTDLITRGGSNQVRCPEQLLGGRDSAKGGQKGGVGAPRCSGPVQSGTGRYSFSHASQAAVVVARSLVLWSAATGATALATR